MEIDPPKLVAFPFPLEKKAINLGKRKKWTLPITQDELRSKIRRMAGQRACTRPHPSTAIKSTKFSILDLILITGIDERGLKYFLVGKRMILHHSGAWTGQKNLARINDLIDLIRGGYVTKSQVGVYHFHDEPVVKPLKEMRVNLNLGKIIGEVILPPAPKKFPDFNKLFG